MITLFNRKELISTFSLSKQAEVRKRLKDNQIEYTVKTVDRRSASSFSAGARARTGTFGENSDFMCQYIIYVKKQDYEQACHLL